MFRKLIPFLAVLLAPIAAFAQGGPCPVSTNGANTVIVNDGTTGTVQNKVVSITAAGLAIVYPHLQTVGAIGVAYYGAGAVPNTGVCVQETGSIAIIADGAVTINHWVTTSTTVDGDIHDTTTVCTSPPPSGVEVVGCAVTASSGAGVAALISLRNFISATGVSQSGTPISGTVCLIIASGINTVQCGTPTDSGTYLKPKETFNLEQQFLVEESTTAAGTYTAQKLHCVTASGTVGDCTSAAANSRAIGVGLAKDGSLPVTIKIGSGVPMASTASVTFTQGDYVCSDPTNAATVVDNSTTPCPFPQIQVGFVKTTDGGNTTTGHAVDLTAFGEQQPGPTQACVPNAFAAQTDAATVTWAIASAICANASLTFTVHSGSRTLNITNPVNGGSYIIWLKQDATGGEGLILGTGCTWKVSGGGAGAITLSSTANAVDVLAFVTDGTNCYANFNKNFN